MLAVEHFAAFFSEVHGVEPFPWQLRLLEQIAAQPEGQWPAVLDLPTGSGKTAAIDIALFHLALEADRKQERRAPVRIAFVVDRRLIVDDAYDRAERIARALRAARPGSVVEQVAARLKGLSDIGAPLLARRLRGGVPREDDWARTPSQPTVLCSTVDQVGSRLLFRGYGISDAMKPVHAGLLGSDCLILLDEAHLAEPFRQTLQWVRTYRERRWREVDDAAPWGLSLLTATPREESAAPFSLDDADRSHPTLKKRLQAAKPARLVAAAKKAPSAGGEGEVDAGGEDEGLEQRVDAIAREVQSALAHFADAASGAPSPAIAVVLNRVLRARRVFELLRETLREEIDRGRIAEPILMIGPARPCDRDSLAEQLRSIRTQPWPDGEVRALEKATVIVATQCIEAGVDIDLDGLITEVAPLDALRQRFGRLNRAGRKIAPYAAIVGARVDLQANRADPVYGKALKHAWDCLLDAAARGGQPAKGQMPLVEFGLESFAVELRPEALSPRNDAPVLLPAHLDLLSQTAPIPAPDPDIALFLHGQERQSDSVTVVWRADIDPDRQSHDELRQLLKLLPPRAAEAIELPLWAVRRWLLDDRRTHVPSLADVAVVTPDDDDERRQAPPGKQVFNWKGDDLRSQWTDSRMLRTGDTIVVPASYGGVDLFGWNPGSRDPASDLGRKAAEPYRGRRLVVRIAPGLIGAHVSNDMLAEALADAESRRWRDLREAMLRLALPEEIRQDLHSLDTARGGRVVPYLDLYGTDIERRPRGIVFVAPLGIRSEVADQEPGPGATEDDAVGSTPGFRLSLARHSADVEAKAAAFAQAAGFAPARAADLKLAGFMHDAGKADPRFQAWLHHGDPLGMDPREPAQLLAKSDRPLPRSARPRSGLPDYWRHEALSVRLALLPDALARASDRELVLWLVGTHHGHGRPFFPHADPADAQARELLSIRGEAIELPAGAGPQSLAFDYDGADWSMLFERLKARYGVWELARMEATLRLADHRASEDAARRNADEDAS